MKRKRHASGVSSPLPAVSERNEDGEDEHGERASEYPFYNDNACVVQGAHVSLEARNQTCLSVCPPTSAVSIAIYFRPCRCPSGTGRRRRACCVGDLTTNHHRRHRAAVIDRPHLRCVCLFCLSVSLLRGGA